MRLADFHVTLIVPDDHDERQLTVMVRQLNRLDLRRLIQEHVQDQLNTTKHLTGTLAIVEE